MQNKKLKKALAGTLTATMVLGMGITTLAQTGTPSGNGTGTGDGTFEGHVDKDVVSVVLPTDTTPSVFNYKMDPEGLIAATDNAAHSGASFETGKNVFFQSAQNTWTSESAKLKVVNKGTVDVDVTVSASTAANDDIAMVDDTTGFTTTNENAELYLGLLVANQNASAIKETPTSGDPAATVTVGLKGNDANYEVAHDGSNYSYAVKANVPDTAWNSFEIGLTGACNPYGDYSAENLAASAVTVTWSYAVREEDSTATMVPENATSDVAPSITTTTYTMVSDTDINIPVSLGAGNLAAEGIDSVVCNGERFIEGTHYNYDESNSQLIFPATMINYWLGIGVTSTQVTITFNDSNATPVTLNFAIASN